MFSRLNKQNGSHKAGNARGIKPETDHFLKLMYQTELPSCSSLWVVLIIMFLFWTGGTICSATAENICEITPVLRDSYIYSSFSSFLLSSSSVDISSKLTLALNCSLQRPKDKSLICSIKKKSYLNNLKGLYTQKLR